MRLISFMPLGWVGLLVAAADCGGAAFGYGSDASVDGPTRHDGGASGSGSSGSGGRGSGASSSGGSSSSGSASGASSSGASGSGGSASSSGASSSGAGSSGAASSGSGIDGGGSGGSGGSGGGNGGSGGGLCVPGCSKMRLCCNGACVNPANDPQNCGGCGAKCDGSTYCHGSSCQPAPCTRDGGACDNGQACCGATCCGGKGQLCCEQSGPVTSNDPVCIMTSPSAPTCPQGCAPLCISDRNLKRDIAPVDEQAVLESVARMPISTWSYKADDPSVRHLGPMAQDFRAAFGLGNTDRAYDPIDAHGIALASIKALYERVEKQQAEIDRLERDNEQLRRKGERAR